MLRWSFILTIVCAASVTWASPGWRSIGPGGGGYFQCVVTSPHASGTVYAGSDVGGFYKSTDAGRHWRICNQGLHSYFVEVIAPHPRDPRVIYIGTEGGVHKSTDGGETWHWLRTGFPPVNDGDFSAPIGALVVYPHEPDTVYAGIGRPKWGRGGVGTIYRTTDGGAHWQVANPGGGGMDPKALVRDLVAHPRIVGRLYAATDRGLYRSDDRGTTWRPLMRGLPHGRIGRIALCAGCPAVMYVTVQSPPGRQPWQGGVYRSDDGGEHWSPRLNGLPAQAAKPGAPAGLTSNVDRLVVHPTDPDVVYAGDTSWVSPGVYRSSDGGRSWRRVTDPDASMSYGWATGTGIAVAGLALDPHEAETLYFCTSMHIFRSRDSGAHWEAAYTQRAEKPRGAPDSPLGWWQSTGPEDTCLHGVVVHPRDPDRLFLCYYDIGLVQSLDGGRTFSRTIVGMHYTQDAFTVAFDPDDPRIVYAATGEWDQRRGDVCRSDDGGFTWKVIGKPETGLPEGQVHHLIVDRDGPARARRVYAAVDEHGLFCSEDGGCTWSARSAGLPSRVIRGLAQHPREPRTLFALLAQDGPERGGLFRSEDRGLTWHRVSGSTAWPAAQALAMSPSDPRRLYVAARRASVEGQAYAGGVFASADGGATWKHVLDNRFIQGLAVDPTDPNVLYASGTDHPYHDDAVGLGVVRSRDGGRIWESLNGQGLANRNVDSLTLDPHRPGRLYASTGGDGVFVRE